MIISNSSVGMSFNDKIEAAPEGLVINFVAPNNENTGKITFNSKTEIRKLIKELVELL